MPLDVPVILRIKPTSTSSPATPWPVEEKTVEFC
jgi:hypothetical protein